MKNARIMFILINNLLYLWIDNPKELKKIYANLFSWLKPGSQIRIFPVYFGRYDMYDKNLKKYIESKCTIEILNPHITAEGMYEWHDKKKKKIYLKKKTVWKMKKKLIKH